MNIQFVIFMDPKRRGTPFHAVGGEGGDEESTKISQSGGGRYGGGDK